MNKKILMLLNAPYPADIRVRKEANALISAGFEIWLLCLRKEGEKYEDLYEGIHIRRIDAGTKKYELAFWDMVMSVNFIHPKFKSAARKILKQENISTIHVHDLPLAGTAIALKKEMGAKVVVDMHENYPEALKTWFQWKTNLIVRLKNFLFMNPQRWERFEKIACEQSDRIIAVVDEMKSRIMRDHSIDSGKITVVTNSEDKAFANQTVDNSVYGELSNNFIIAYAGGIGPHRGVDVAIKAMQWVKSTPQIQLVVIGSGSAAVMNNLRELVSQLGLHNVHFYGYQPFSKFYSYMSLASVNVIPHHSNGHTDNTVPHKLFQSMMAAKPLVVSSSAPLKRLISEYEAGLIFEAGDDKGMADQIMKLYNDRELFSRLGENGKKVTLSGSVNWDEDQKKLISLYEKF